MLLQLSSYYAKVKSLPKKVDLHAEKQESTWLDFPLWHLARVGVKKNGGKKSTYTLQLKKWGGGQLRVDRVHSHMRTFSKASTNESKKVSYVLCTAVCTVFGHWISTSCQIATIIGCFGGTSLGNPVTNSSTKSQFISEWGFLVDFLHTFLWKAAQKQKKQAYMKTM